MTSTFLDALAGTKLYPITDREISGLSHPEQVDRLSAEGYKVIQLREKILPAKEFFREAEAAVRIARARNVKVIINDRVDIAMAVGADGVHLGQDDMPPAAARSLLGPDSIIGFSTHSLAQAAQAAPLPVDYVAIGPIFPTSTKQSTNSPVGLEQLQSIRGIVDGLPLVAIGGLTLENSAKVLAGGVDACALISDLWPRLR
jgi:thiamine-phosphate pyrophosphorylase